MKRKAIGLLGGSFNPAHEGHLYISNAALQNLKLDAVWWLVSPQNPLKSASELDDFDARIAGAKQIAKSGKIHVSDFERDQPVSYTANSLTRLVRSYPDCAFVWLMGADNLAQIPKWYRWEKIFQLCPVAIFDRPGQTYPSLCGRAAQRYRRSRIFPSVWGKPIQGFAHSPLPAWTFVPYTKHKMSSTQIRKSGKKQGKACS
ncbi:nicotinate (nicotinamide) nucleotide adenylyltransferase [Sneathiella glossodoripedis]|uniref:nicotinate (nicotinamide) nucleotide adenylyltransferase n=1 Tax=Sneathiella glossodoripedis TaxID=418853 RepID=UPI00047011AC|nr:nicotinate (nicotinamide) nucleotide adenylyltransferase [Sneathiella glossodoripedis]